MKRHTLETTSKQRRHSSVPSENGGTRGYGGGEKPSRDKNKTKKIPLPFGVVYMKASAFLYYSVKLPPLYETINLSALRLT